jgi:Protein of unknown function (DUF1654)
MDIQQSEGSMAKAQKQSKPAVREEMGGVERLGLRVSSMINHPVAQTQRWVTVHRLDTDGEREWDEVMGLLSETDGLDIAINNDGSVTLRWEPSKYGEWRGEAEDAFAEEEATPF